MKLSSQSFENNGRIPSQYAFGRAANPVELSDNLNPHLAWDEAPANSKSFVLTCIDKDAPSLPDNVNQAGKTVPYDLPRADFVHWVMVNIAADCRVIEAGSHSSGVVAGGKQNPNGLGPQGLNDYTSWFAGDADMQGRYFGYDGPCPPWNDERFHHYHFTLYALDVDTLTLPTAFTASDVQSAIKGHVLAQASLSGHYHIYPNAR